MSELIPWVKGAIETGLSQVESVKTSGKPTVTSSIEEKPKVPSIEDSSILVPKIKDTTHPY